MGVAFYGRRLDDPGVAAPFAELHRAQQAALAVAEGSQFRDDRVDGYAFDSPSTVQLASEYAADSTTSSSRSSRDRSSSVLNAASL